MLAPGQMQLVSFEVGDLRCASRLEKVEEVVAHLPSTRVPNAPSFVEGMIDLRGRVVPVVSLRKRFHVEGAPPVSPRILIVRLDRGAVGFLADRVGMMRAPMERVQPAPAYIPGIDAAYLAGVVRHEEGIVLLLDLEKVLSPQEVAQIPKE